MTVDDMVIGQRYRISYVRLKGMPIVVTYNGRQNGACNLDGSWYQPHEFTILEHLPAEPLQPTIESLYRELLSARTAFKDASKQLTDASVRIEQILSQIPSRECAINLDGQIVVFEFCQNSLKDRLFTPANEVTA